MLEILASVATILGFSIQVAELASSSSSTNKSQRANDLSLLNETDIAFAVLYALSTTAKSWKSLHARYHPLGMQIHSVIAEISNQKNGHLVPKNIGDIAPNSIRELFYDGILNDAVANFAANTRKEIRQIRSSFDNSNPKLNAALTMLGNLDHTLANEFLELSACRKDALEIHDRFLKFLSDVSGFISRPSWGENEMRYILDNMRLLHNDLPQMVFTTDKVLMSFLEIYIKLVNDHAKSSNIPSILQKL